jgi:hypothetical protein
MNERTYKQFTPKENNTTPISADHINELQKTLERTQEELFYQADVAFLSKSLFTLDQHPDANSMIVDTLEDASRVDSTRSQSVSYIEETNSIAFDHPTSLTGVFRTRAVQNETRMPMRKVILLTDEYTPEGAKIDYEISYDAVVFHPITPNYAIPLETGDERGEIYIRATFSRLTEDLQPRIDAWAILYQDETYAFRYLDDGINLGVEAGWDGTIVK